LIGYGRVLLLFGAIGLAYLNGGSVGSPDIGLAFVVCIAISLLLDLLDGHLARKFGHTSRFGALFDLSIDIVTHTVVWIASGWRFALIFIVIEWTAGLLAFVQTMRSESSWKQNVIADGSWALGVYFGNHQRNLISTYCNVAHFMFPAALILGWTNLWGYALAVPGLAVYEAVTIAISVDMLRNGRHRKSKRV
jgi:phosphatidylglycerophosphate synthase